MTSTLVTSTTNITGFLIIRRGSSFVNDSIAARETISRFQSAGAFRSVIIVTSHGCLEEFPGHHQELFDNRSERDGAEKGQRADDQNYADQQKHKRDAVSREGPGAGRGGFFGGARAGNPAGGTPHPHSPGQHAAGQRTCEERSGE